MLVTSIRDCVENEYLTTITNGGSQLYTQLEKLIIFIIEVQYKSDSMDNIISFKDVTSILGVHIKMDIEKETVITVALKSGKLYKFVQCSKGLYDFDTRVLNVNDKPKNSINAYIVIQPVKFKKIFH